MTTASIDDEAGRAEFAGMWEGNEPADVIAARFGFSRLDQVYRARVKLRLEPREPIPLEDPSWAG